MYVNGGPSRPSNSNNNLLRLQIPFSHTPLSSTGPVRPSECMSLPRLRTFEAALTARMSPLSFIPIKPFEL